MLRVLTWLWRPPRTYRSQFHVEHVNTMRALVAKYCTLEHEFLCITDQPAAAFDPRVRVVPLWTDHADLPSAFALGPSCYRRLRIFASDAHELLGVEQGDTVVSLDLDSIPVRSLDPLWDLDTPFCGWFASPRAPCCGSMFLHRLGSLPYIWETFHYMTAKELAKRHGFVGTDQAWLACKLAARFHVWTVRDGVLSFKNDCVPKGVLLPEHARVVFFTGKPDPWDNDVRRQYPWVREHYPIGERDADIRLQGTV